MNTLASVAAGALLVLAAFSIQQAHAQPEAQVLGDHSMRGQSSAAGEARIDYTHVFTGTPPGVVDSSVLAAITDWLSTNFDLPAIHDHPRVEFVSPARITALRYNGLVSPTSDASGPTGQRSVVAVYHHGTGTIYLPEGWTGSSPAESSVLVHEMVHHLQYAGNLKFECPQEREELAYKAQEQWLALFGRDLMQDFELDPFTILLTTRCGF